VRPGRVEVAAEALDVELCVEEREELVLIEVFIAELLVEALDMRVLHGLPGLDELQRDAAIGGPRVEGATADLSSDSRVGWPRTASTASSAAITAVLGRLWATVIAKHSRVQLSMSVRHRKRRPLAS